MFVDRCSKRLAERFLERRLRHPGGIGEVCRRDRLVQVRVEKDKCLGEPRRIYGVGRRGFALDDADGAHEERRAKLWLYGMVDGLVQNPYGRVCHALHVCVDAGDRDGRTGADGDVVVLPHYGYVVGNGSSEFEARLEEVLCPDVVHAEDGGARRKGGDPRLQAREQPGEMVFPELDLRNLLFVVYEAVAASFRRSFGKANGLFRFYSAIGETPESAPEKPLCRHVAHSPYVVVDADQRGIGR